MNIISISDISIEYSTEHLDFIRKIDLKERLFSIESSSSGARPDLLNIFIEFTNCKTKYKEEDVTDNIIEYIENTLSIDEYIKLTNIIENILYKLVVNDIVNEKKVTAANTMVAVIVDLKQYLKDDAKYNALKEKNQHILDVSTLLAAKNQTAYHNCIDYLLKENLDLNTYETYILIHVKPYVELFVEELKTRVENGNSSDGTNFKTGIMSEEEIMNMVNSDSLSPAGNISEIEKRKMVTRNKQMLKQMQKGAMDKFLKKPENV